MKITKKMSFAEILEKKPESAEILMSAGMHCFGCPMAQMETLEQGCIAHGIDADEIVEKLNNIKDNE